MTDRYERIRVQPSPGAEAEPERLRLIPLTERMPDPDKHPRVVVYTEGYDFQGEQFFDVDAESLNENRYADPADQPEVCRYATHWIGANDLARLTKAIARPSPTYEAVKLFINRVEKIAMSMKAPNIYTPQLMEACVAMRAAIAAAPSGEEQSVRRNAERQTEARMSDLIERLRQGNHPAITHCDNCGCDWLDNGLNPIGCPYCKQNVIAQRGEVGGA